jgi:flagellar basal-body rod protein FlgC
MNAVSIALSGMRAASARLDAAASNLANMSDVGAVPNSDAKVTTPLYQPLSVHTYQAGTGAEPAGVNYQITPTSAYVQVYDPTAPEADSSGMVAMPNVDVASTLVDTLYARSQFEALAKVIKATDHMQRAAINIMA